ncbi:MAG: acetyl-CoA hydrolase/transferase C-terminal domain-containing protein [Syntrophomonadaceae bacterium]|nr:acetyl-CoA hydrolase/transferase C-terminal domain-containing protein [Syntrophomonadaceae bacterium]
MSNTYLQEYRRKLISAEKAAALVQSGDHILYGVFLGRPYDFDMELAKRRDELFDVQVTQCSGNTVSDNSAFADPSGEHFTSNSWFFDITERQLADRGMIFYNPCQFGQLQDMIGSDLFPYDIYVQKVSPMDRHGWFSFGLTNVNSLESCLSANKMVILEVNENMPRVPGGSEDAVHISMVDYVIESSNPPLKTLPPPLAASPAEKKMAEYIVELIPDRACLQLGIGGIPNTVGELLVKSDLKDLGIHTEMFVDSMVTLSDSGLVTGRYKATDRCKITFTFALASQESYDFMAENPLMASQCGRFTNDVNVIGRNDNFISINSTVMMDLYSQACSESAGPRQISGTGGQVDFITGAWKSKGGKSFLCLSSSFQDRMGILHSRIVPTVPGGGIVTTPRTLIDYVVTEYGITQLKGKPTWHRAEELVRLSHPAFRDELIKQAQQLNIWRRTNKQDA